MSNLTKPIVLTAAMLCIVQLATCKVPRGYPKLCIEERKYNKTVTITEKQPVQVEKYDWCLTVPFRCTKYTTEIQTVVKNETIEKSQNILVCCPGYIESPDGQECLPICEPECQNGVCDLSGNCVCDVGYVGASCNQPCDENFYGMNCTTTCQCQNGGTCHHISGECNCTLGWTGQFCEEACPKVEGTHVCGTSFEINGRKSATDFSRNSNQESSVLFDVEINSEQLAELSKKFARGDWIFSVSARRVETAEEPASHTDSGSVEAY